MQLTEMSELEIIPKQKVLCEELNTGKYYNGFFYFDENVIKAEVCSFGEFFYIKKEGPIFLHSENNHIISLHSNLTGPAGTCSRNVDPKMVTYKQRIISNTAVIGHNKWEEDDLIKRVTFNVKHTDELLKHKETFDKFIGNKKFDDLQPNIFSLTVGNLTIRVGYCATYLSEYNEPRKIWPSIEIEFEEAVTLFAYLEDVECIVRFFSLSVGVPLKPSDFKICKLSSEDMLAAINSNSYPGDYSVKYIWPEIDFYDNDLWVRGSLAIAYNDEELETLKNCLITWVSNYDGLRKASIQMMCCLSMNKEISSDRLLAACKWFEEISLTKSENIISNEHIQIISNIASDKAVDLGYSDINNRVSGALKSIKSETHEDKFKRLVKLVHNKYGLKSINLEIVVHLKKVIEFRGRVAHGHFSPSTDEEFRVFSKSIYAMEALCFLLTAHELPINDDGIERIHYNPFIQHYRLS